MIFIFFQNCLNAHAHNYAGDKTLNLLCQRQCKSTAHVILYINRFILLFSEF